MKTSEKVTIQKTSYIKPDQLAKIVLIVSTSLAIGLMPVIFRNSTAKLDHPAAVSTTPFSVLGEKQAN